MEITKFTHSCIRVSAGGRSLVIDPGTFSPLPQALEGAEAILATHVHPDHLDLEAVVAAMGRDPRLVFHGPAVLAAHVLEAATAASVPGAAARIHGVRPGETFTAAGMDVSTHGGMHAVIHHALPVVANIGYFIDRTLYHPGDSYQVPEGIKVHTLLVPAHAPWAKIGETIEYLSMVNAPVNIPIHDGLLNERGLSLVDGHLGRVAAERGLDYRRIPDGTPVVLEGR